MASEQKNKNLRATDGDSAESGKSAEAADSAVGSEAPASHTALPYRRKKRGAMAGIVSTWKAMGARFLNWYSCVPVAVVLAGSFYVALANLDGLSAFVVSLLTSCLGGLSLYVISLQSNQGGRASLSLQYRFEKLEDRAWELHESEERYRSLAEAFGDILVMRDRDGKITYCNNAFAKILETNKQDLLDHGTLPPNLLEQLANINPATASVEIVLENSGEKFWFQWHDLDVRDAKTGGTARLSVARDVTAFKQSSQIEEEARRKAEEASQTKSRFLAMASHEMRTPLNGIIGMSKLLANTKLSPEQQNYTTALTSSGENLLGLIESMLDLTMIEAGRFELKKEEFDFHALMNNAVELLSSRAYLKNIDFGLFIDPSVPTQLLSDPGRLRQIIFNLAGNAIKFTSIGGVMVRCSLRDSRKYSNPVLKIEVVDSGPGMNEEDCERIFLEFERVDDDITRKTDGAGLGLAIAKALTGELGGALELTNTGKTGSTFTVEIPVQETSKFPVQDAATTKRKRVRKAVTHNILLISKNKMEAICLVDTVRSTGNRICWQENTNQIANLENAGNGHYSAILIDPENMDLTKSSVNELGSFLKENGKLIIVTLPEKKPDLTIYSQMGVHNWLVRPVRSQSLFAVLNDSAEGNLHVIETSFQSRNKIGSKSSRERAGLQTKGRVLLAEDNDINALLVTAALSRCGIEVIRVENGKAAVECFLKSIDHSVIDHSVAGSNPPSSFDMILMDMHMPIMGGLEAMQEIRRHESLGCLSQRGPVVIFALTADEQAKSKALAQKAGANGFLVKPIDPQKLTNLVISYLQGHFDTVKLSG